VFIMSGEKTLATVSAIPSAPNTMPWLRSPAVREAIARQIGDVACPTKN